MKTTYWWISTSNGCEHDGPFDTIDEAKRAAVDAMESVNDTASIIIAKKVSKGEVTATFVWKDN